MINFKNLIKNLANMKNVGSNIWVCTGCKLFTNCLDTSVAWVGAISVF